MKRWSWADLGSRPAVFPAAAFALGCAASPWTTPHSGLLLVVAAGSGSTAWVFRRRAGAHLALLSACALAGLALGGAAARRTQPPLPSGAVHLEGVVTAVDPGPEGVRLGLEATRILGPGGGAVQARVRLWGPSGGPPLLAGQRVQLSATLHQDSPTDSWGEWDRFAAARRRAARASGRFDPFTVLPLSPPSRVTLWVADARAGLAVAARRAAPTPESAALFLTLAAGLRAELGPTWEDRFARSGLAHVLSVSGLHVAALAVALLFVLRALLALWPVVGRRLDPRRPAALCAIPALWGYVAFTGLQPPAVRSAAMASVLLAGMALWRRADPLNSLGLSVLALLAVDPADIGDLSFELSALAVLALILLAPALRGVLPVRAPDPQRASAGRLRFERLRETALGTVCASAAATAASTPLIASAFHRVSLAGLVSNVVCLPVCGLLTAAAAGGAAAFCVHPAVAVPFLWVGTRLAAALLWATERWASCPGATVALPSFGVGAGLAWAAGLLLFAVARGRLRWGALATPLALGWVWLAPLWPLAPALEVTFLAVGQGDAILVGSRGAWALVDGGGVPGGVDPGARVVLPYLRERGVRRLDLAVLSHPHPDHALGLITALQAIPTDRLWLPDANDDGPLIAGLLAAAPNALVERVHAGRRLMLGEAQVEVLGPPADAALLRGVNDRSLVLRVAAGRVRLLLPGDIEAEGEAALEPGAVTVLKAPHHGSRSSSSEAFVAQTRPGLVIFSVGRENRFGFPAEEVVSRWRASGATCLRTDRHGSVRVHSDGRGVTWETFHPEQEGGRGMLLADRPAERQPALR